MVFHIDTDEIYCTQDLWLAFLAQFESICFLCLLPIDWRIALHANTLHSLYVVRASLIRPRDSRRHILHALLLDESMLTWCPRTVLSSSRRMPFECSFSHVNVCSFQRLLNFSVAGAYLFINLALYWTVHRNEFSSFVFRGGVVACIAWTLHRSGLTHSFENTNP